MAILEDINESGYKETGNAPTVKKGIYLVNSKMDILENVLTSLTIKNDDSHEIIADRRCNYSTIPFEKQISKEKEKK